MADDDLPPGVRADLADIIYRIDPEEVPLLAHRRRPLTKKERRKLKRLEKRRKWKKLARYRAKLDELRGPAGIAEIGARQVITEWIVQELNPPAKHAPGLTVETQEDTMVTRASASQGTKTVPRQGQNKPVSGGAAGQGKARGAATMPNITKTSPKTIPTKR